MKYFTKEWYELCQKTSFHLLLEEEAQAETFSEQYFQKIYKMELNNWLTLQQEVDSLLKDDETADIDDNNCHESFNKDEAIQQFNKSLLHTQEYLKNELPETILKQIADIRVFALNKATRHVINAVTQFCEENETAVTKTSKEYSKYIKKASKLLGEGIVENFSFHDCTIIKIDKNERYLTLHVDNTGIQGAEESKTSGI